MIENDPELERDINHLCSTPQYRRLKRYVMAEDSDGGDAEFLANLIVQDIRDKLLDFDAQNAEAQVPG